MVLDQASKARRISLELNGVEYASELSGKLKAHAEKMEKHYTDLQAATAKANPDMKTLKNYLHTIESQSQWFEKAEAGALSISCTPQS